MATDTSENASRDEVGKFDALAGSWWDESGPLATLHAINPLRTEYIAQRAELAGARVLDVGCGAGILCESLARMGARVSGIDLATASVEAARAHAAGAGLPIDYRECSIDAVAAAEPGQYDIVTCLELLEHVPCPEDIVRACTAAVRPGGSLFFSTINRNPKAFLLAIVGAEYLLDMVPRGTHEYLKLVRPSELAGALRDAGAELRELTGLHFNPLTRTYRLGGNVDVNYLAFAERPEAA